MPTTRMVDPGAVMARMQVEILYFPNSETEMTIEGSVTNVHRKKYETDVYFNVKKRNGREITRHEALIIKAKFCDDDINWIIEDGGRTISCSSVNIS